MRAEEKNHLPGANEVSRPSAGKIFLLFFRLGATSFGGPIAHLGRFRTEWVERRQWVDAHAYEELVALCQLLPGPASSQVGMALGASQAGTLGALAALLGFALPACLFFVLIAMGLSWLSPYIGHDWIHGFKVATVAIVTQALWTMSKPLHGSKIRLTLALVATVFSVLFPSALGPLVILVCGGAVGWACLRPQGTLPHRLIRIPLSKRGGALFLSLFFVLLAFLPLASLYIDHYAVKLFVSFYRAGSLVFGGGHVVLPALQSQVVPQGWVSNDAFLAGYGIAQAAPGPLFAFAAYLGAVSNQTPAGWVGAGIAATGIFLPSFLLVMGVLPFWESLRRHQSMQRAMLGVHAAVIGILFAALYKPIWVSAIDSVGDFCVMIVAFFMLTVWKWPSWLVVILTAAVSLGIARLA